ncbi:Uncharacterised protein [Klebsiella pneumoniae]|nr:Uncharacterised protein [Klebsiella pneumoniae]SXM15997.1 Uncharacterised protein [Klebsiella pneumoniae]
MKSLPFLSIFNSRIITSGMVSNIQKNLSPLVGNKTTAGIKIFNSNFFTCRKFDINWIKNYRRFVKEKINAFRQHFSS